jgi:hypothetical protein
LRIDTRLRSHRYCSRMAATRLTGRPSVTREAHPVKGAGRLGRARARGAPLRAVLALAAYCGLSVLAFGRKALSDPSHIVEGFGQAPRYYGHDQSAYVWSLQWAERALAHGQNLFLTHEIFAPVGYNLAWAASVFGPGLLSIPLTRTLGAVGTYNVLALAAPAGAAWTSFLLCRQVCGRTAPAFAGGLLFGFGTYESVEMVNHLNLALVALVPLAALLVLRRHAGQMSRRAFVIALGAVLGLQFWTSTEVFASLALFGGVAFLLALWLGGARLRPAIWACALETLGALALALVLAAPYLYYALHYANPVSEISTANAGVDLANLVVPSQVTWLHVAGGVSAQMGGNLTERVGYLGAPLLLVLVAYRVEFRDSRLARGLLALIGVAVVLSFGAEAVVAGNATAISLPWWLLGKLPLLRFATPDRFVVYAWLALAVAVACWLARPAHGRLRWAALALVLVSLAPNFTTAWGTRVDEPPLLRSPALARYVPPGGTVLALPFGIAGDSMFWQREADFRFRLAGGYVSVSMPAQYQPYLRLVSALQGNLIAGRVKERVCRFLAMTGAGVILRREGAPGYWAQLLEPLGVRPLHVGGFAVYELGGPGGADGACAAVHRPARGSG